MDFALGIAKERSNQKMNFLLHLSVIYCTNIELKPEFGWTHLMAYL
jgi:hypothetical protein